MNEIYLGKVKSGSGTIYEVKWNEENKKVFVSFDGLTEIGIADAPASAMLQANEWLKDK